MSSVVESVKIDVVSDTCTNADIVMYLVEYNLTYF